MKRKLLIYCLLMAVGCWLTADAKVTLPQLFQSGMVLQRGKPVPIWGKANAGEQVTVSWQKKQYAATADANGRWRVDLPKMKAGGPYTLEVKGEGVDEEKLVFEDVMVGDVWLLSGQSNIDVTIERVYPQYVDEIEHFNLPQVRLFRVQNETNTHGVQDDIRRTSINWKPLTKQNAWLFSAVGSFFGKRMWEKNKVAQGIIVNSWGGTPIEAWISADSLKADYPMLLKRLAIYQNDKYIRAQAQANAEANNRWQELLDKEDDVRNYSQPGYQDGDWKTIDQNNWNWRGAGSVWLRQHIHIDKEHAGKPARLLLGTLYDQDVTYLNGQEIGHTYYQYPPRRYDIREGLLREGDNVIAVRFINKNGAVHFIPEKPYLIAFGDDRFSQNPMPKDVIPLGQTWKMQVGVEMPNCPGGDVSMQNQPTALYNAVLYPLAPYAINGVVWYQGESNTGKPTPYADYLKKLMGSWRACNSNWARLREAQRLAAESDARAELAVINDLGETVDIHPLRKKEVAERIGLCFDRLIYNNKVKLSPVVLSAEVQNDKVVLTLDQPVQAGTLNDFELAGADGRFVNAEAEVSSGNPNVITLRAAVTAPKRVRYAWKDNPVRANVRSLSGLPMSSFDMYF